jgi:hypothetical protein
LSDLQEEKMCAKFDGLWIFCLFALLSILGLTGCGGVAEEPNVLPSVTEAPPEQLTVVGPESARDVALAYIRTYHPEETPPKEAFWFEETETLEGQVGSSAVRYRYESWVVTVTFPVVDPDATLYTVTVERASPEYYWQGLVDAYGQVVEISFKFDDPEPTMPAPTSTSIPSATATPTGTPTATPTKPATPTYTSTPVPEPCNAAEFVSDVTIQDGSVFPAGADFTKIWRLKNTGTCAWTSNYDLVFVDGWLMDGDLSQPLPNRVAPGESVDISIELRAPEDPGDYQGLWKLRDAGGVLFGVGEGADKAFWVSIGVLDFIKGDYAFDFALNYCSAGWGSESGRLTCPGFSNSPDGFVQLLSNAELEYRRENEPTLWVHPNEARYGWIEGIYPSYKVQTGDRFMAWVGCLGGYERCNLTFYLDYENRDGSIYRLGEWVETYDSSITQIDMDLSALEGDRIRFILGVEGNTKNVEDAQGFWFVPRIE